MSPDMGTVTTEAADRPRTIVMLLDGTSNQITKRRTHMLRLYGALHKSADQIVYYDPGVGTFGADNALSSIRRRATEVFGLATGRGLMTNVLEAYEFLMNTYRPGDRVVLSGFSRGAYTARVLAGFCHAVGLVEARNRNLLSYALRAYKAVNASDRDTGGKEANNPFAGVQMVNRVLDAPRITIDALLLFDTVSSMIDWGTRGPMLRSYAFSSHNPSVKAVRHALAIDERRWLFRHTLWQKGEHWGGAYERPKDPALISEQDVEEVWFTGVHGDIGGGVPEAQSGLGKIPLKWMIDEAARLGVEFDPKTVRRIVDGAFDDDNYVPPDPVAFPQISLTAPWWVAEVWPFLRKQDGWGETRLGMLGYYPPLGERRVIKEGAKIHHSVFARRGSQADFAQPNIPAIHERV